jgi:hypothetical protein
VAPLTQYPIEHLDAFSDWLATKGNKTNTIWSHRGRLLQIGRWFEARHGEPLSPTVVAPWLFEEYASETNRGDRAARSSLFHYADWAVETGQLALNPFRPFDEFEALYLKLLKDLGYAETTIRFRMGYARSFVTWYVSHYRHQLGDEPLPADVVSKYQVNLHGLGRKESTIEKHISGVSLFLSLIARPLGLDIGALTLSYPRRLILSKDQIAALEERLAQDPNDRRAQALLLLTKGVSANDVAAKIGVAVQTIYNWKHRFRSHVADG